MSAVLYSMSATQSRLLPEIEKCLSSLSENVDQDTLKTLLLLKNELTQFEASVHSIGIMLKKLLNDEGDMANMVREQKFAE